MKKTILKTAVITILGAGFVVSPTAQATVVNYSFDAVLTKLNHDGSVISIQKGTDQYLSHLTGIMQYDTVSGTGTAVFEPFGFDHSTPASEITNYTTRAIGDGMGGPGTLMLTNFLVDAFLVTGMPVSMVHDAAGFFNGELTSGGANSATPASDGTIYTNIWSDGSTGYLGLGPVPIATTAWNTSNTAGCSFENCLGVAVSGTLPLGYDSVVNSFDSSANTGGGIGGSPSQDGRYRTSNVNIDFTTMTVVPVPASVWLFGSGLVSLIGLSRRKKS